MTSEAEKHAVEQHSSSVPAAGLDQRIHRLLRVFDLAVGCVALTIAALVLVGGWIAGVDALKSVLPEFATMKVNTALGIGMLGAALTLKGADARYRRAGNILAGVALLVGVVTLAEYAFEWHAGIDELFIKDIATPSASAPGRPAAATAMTIALLGAALLCVGSPALVRAKALSACTAALIAWATLNGYVFGPLALHEVSPFSSVALLTAILLFLLGVAVLAADPVPRTIRTVFVSGTGGVICRWLLPPAILAPPILGWLLSRAVMLNYFPTQFGSALYSVLSTLGSMWLILALAHRITVIDAERSAANERSRQLRQALNDRETFKAAIENSSDFIGIADAEGVPVYLNPAGRRMVGIDADFPIGRIAVAECYPPELRDFATGVILNAMREHGRWQGETFFRHFKTQQLIPVSDTHFMVRDSVTGGILGSATITRDISEIKHARDESEATQRKLAEANRRLQRITQDQQIMAEASAIFASTLNYEETLRSVARMAVREFADHCWVVLSDGRGEIQRLVAVSRDLSLAWACEILTKSPLRPDLPHMAGETLRTQRSILMECLSPETVASFAQGNAERLEALRALNPRSAITVPLVAHGKLLGVLAFMSAGNSRSVSVEDLWLAESLALQAALSIENARLFQAAQRAVQARDEMLGIVAHDLRSPLNAIVMQAEILKLGKTAQDGRSSAPSEVIHRSVERMNRLIQDLLDVARVEAGRFTVERVRVATRQLVAEATESHRSLAAEKSIELLIEAAADAPDVWADRDRLLQVFENLISNAIKFTGSNGQIIVRVQPADDALLFSITDTGIGISAEELPHVFDRFWQARRGVRHGAGLGLPIVEGIVEAHDGRIWAMSVQGQGTTIFFTIPIPPQPGDALPESARR